MEGAITGNMHPLGAERCKKCGRYSVFPTIHMNRIDKDGKAVEVMQCLIDGNKQGRVN